METSKQNFIKLFWIIIKAWFKGGSQYPEAKDIIIQCKTCRIQYYWQDGYDENFCSEKCFNKRKEQ